MLMLLMLTMVMVMVLMLKTLMTRLLIEEEFFFSLTSYGISAPKDF